jgi:predicted amidohydrolase YtcJ
MKKLWLNGTILTMDPKVSGDAVLTENGMILAVGSALKLRRQNPDAAEENLQGHVLLPGFIDPHSHFSQVASGLMQADLDGADSCAEIGRRLQAFVQERRLRQDAWVTAKNYDTSLMPGGRNPDLAEIDSFLRDHPLVIQQKSGHMGLFNSAALSALGITAKTPDPQGGRIGRKDGKLTGYLEENAYFEYQKKTPMPAMEEFLAAYRQAQDLYASFGITTLQEGMMVAQMFPLYHLLEVSHIMKLDLVSYPDAASCDQAAAEFPELLNGYHDHIRIGGIKIFLDGSPQGRTAWMRTPYQGEKDYCGYGTMKEEEVLAALRKAAALHTQILAHCNGDAAAAQYIRCALQVEQEAPWLAELRPVIIHAQLLGIDQMADAVRAGMTASFFVAHVYHWGDVHIRNFGLERASEISPAQSALRAGLPFTFHQDSPVIMPDMIETLWCAVNRITKSGVLLGAQERISIRDALHAVTLGAARQYGEEDRKGSLTPGKQADFVILDRDPMTVTSADLRSLQVLRTVKGGETVFSRSAKD